MADPFFNAKFRFMKAKNKSSDRAPDYNLVIDFTKEDAMKAAQYLMTKGNEAEMDGTTVRIYTGQGKEDYTEKPGFSIWGSMWGNPSDEGSSGKIAPIK
jgi:hypothetical protein